MSEASHVEFVIAAYAIAALVIAGMIAAILADYRAQSAALARLEGRGRDGKA